MAIELRQSFQIRAPIEAGWAFLLDPKNVVACMPGASLTPVIEENSCVGAVKVKGGAVPAQYQGTITYTGIDAAARVVTMLAEGKERGGGTVKGTIVSRLSSIEGGVVTNVETSSSFDLTGKIVQVGRGMIEGISAQIIKMYVGNVRAMLEPIAAAAATAAPGIAAPPPARQESINIVAVVARTLWEGIKGFFKRLFGQRSS